MDSKDRQNFTAAVPCIGDAAPVADTAVVTRSLRAAQAADPLAFLELLVAILPPVETSRDVYRAG